MIKNCLTLKLISHDKKLFSLSLIILVAFFINGCKQELESDGLVFDGESDYIDFENSPSFDANDSFTFELWIKLLEDINVSSVLFGPKVDAVGAHGLYTYYSGRISFGVRTRDNIAWTSFTNYNVGIWTHIAGVYDGDKKAVYLYANGEYVGSDKFTGEATNFSENNFFMNYPSIIGGPVDERGRINCIIKDVRMWEIALTEAQIRNNKDKTLEGNEEGLIGYWPLNETEGSLAHDLTENEMNGKVHGAEWRAQVKWSTQHNQTTQIVDMDSILLQPAIGLVCPKQKLKSGFLPKHHKLHISPDSSLPLDKWKRVSNQSVEEILGTSEPGEYSLFYVQLDEESHVVFKNERKIRIPESTSYQLLFNCETHSDCPVINIYPVYINGKSARFIAQDHNDPLRILAQHGRRLFLSNNGGFSWKELRVSGNIDVGLFLPKNRLLMHLNQTRIVYDIGKGLIISKENSELGWHMSWNANYANGVVMYAEYSSVYQDNKVYRSRDYGSTWEVVFELPKSDPPPIRHFHTIQPDPYNEGFWYLSSGDRPNESRMWMTKNHGDNWVEITADVSQKPFNQAVHRTTAKHFLPDYLIWGTDDRAGTDEALLIKAKIDSGKLFLDNIGNLGDEYIRSLIKLDNGFLFVSERKITERETRKASKGINISFYCLETRQITMSTLPVTNENKSTGFTNSRSSHRSHSNRFFTFGSSNLLETVDDQKTTQMLMWSICYN